MFLTAQSFLLVIALGAINDVQWWARAIAAFISCIFGFISIQKFERDRLMVVSDAEQLLDIERRMIKLGHPGMEVHDKQIRRKYINKELLTKKLERKKIQNNFNSLSTIVFWQTGMWITTGMSFGIFLLTLLLELNIIRDYVYGLNMQIIAVVFLGILLSIILMILDYTCNSRRLSLRKGTIFKILLVCILLGTLIGTYYASQNELRKINIALSAFILLVVDGIYFFWIRKLCKNVKDVYKNIQVLILAGGDGTRLSGITKNKVPKFLAVKCEEMTLLENAISRNKEISGKQVILAYKGYERRINETTGKKNLDTHYEEYNRGTGTAIFNYLKTIDEKVKKDAILVIVPSDHVIHDIQSYQDDIKDVCTLARDFNFIYLIGIEPNYPTTDYGYFGVDENVSYRITKVCDFVEKPELIDAEKMIHTGKYYWNSGIFIAKASVFEHEFMACCAAEFKEYENKEAYDKEAYLRSQTISFDKAVLEKSDKLYAIIGSFDWIDIGDPIRLQGAIKEDICSMNEKYFMEDI